MPLDLLMNKAPKGEIKTKLSHKQKYKAMNFSQLIQFGCQKKILKGFNVGRNKIAKPRRLSS